MKSIKSLWIAPVVGVLTLVGCSSPPHSQTTQAPEAATAGTPAPSQVSATQVSQYVNLIKNAPNIIGVGEQFTYDLIATAQADVAEVTVVDSVPTAAEYVSSEPAAAQDGNKLVWKLPAMTKGESKTIHVTVKAKDEGQLVHCASASAIPQVCITTLVGRPQLNLKKTGPATAQLGQAVSYDILVQNTGNVVAKNVVVTDALPEELSGSGDQKEIKFEVGDIAPGASKAVNVPVKATKRGKATNSAIAIASNAPKVSAEALTAIVQPDVKLQLAAKSPETFVNRAVPYDLVVENTGDVPLTGVVLNNTAAPETLIAAAEGANVNGTVATWNVGSLAPGEKKAFTLKIVSKVAGKFTDGATVTTVEGPKDSAQDATTWRGVTGLALELADDPDPIMVGEVTKHTVRVTNQGTASDVSELDVVVTLPPNLELVAGTCSDSGTVEGNKITWPRVSALAPKASVVHTYVVKGVKAGDARTSVSITTSQRKTPIVQTESTTVY